MGDSACWLDRICLECGRFVDDDHAEGGVCPHCGAELLDHVEDATLPPR